VPRDIHVVTPHPGVRACGQRVLVPGVEEGRVVRGHDRGRAPGTAAGARARGADLEVPRLAVDRQARVVHPAAPVGAEPRVAEVDVAGPVRYLAAVGERLATVARVPVAVAVRRCGDEDQAVLRVVE